MATYVLVPGGWSGGWQFRDVAAFLRRAGHDVFTPTLTGLGERDALAHPEVNLYTHILDIVNVLLFEDLHNVILVGYSYSGMVVTGVADQVPDRIARLVYLDALVPQDGQSLADLLGPEVMGMLTTVARQYGDGWRVPHNPPDTPRVTDHPLQTALQAVNWRHPQALALPRTFIFCSGEKDPTDPLLVPIARMAAVAKTDPHWRYRELPTGHLPWETAPRELADVLLEFA